MSLLRMQFNTTKAINGHLFAQVKFCNPFADSNLVHIGLKRYFWTLSSTIWNWEKLECDLKMGKTVSRNLISSSWLCLSCSTTVHKQTMWALMLMAFKIWFYNAFVWFTKIIDVLCDADHHGPPKVNFWQDPMSPSKWKEEHVSFSECLQFSFLLV